MWAKLFGGKKKPAAVPPKPSTRTLDAFGPPLTDEEHGANLSELERRLNGQMKCAAGKNQVFIRSLLTGRGTTPPRIALKCTYRRDLKQPSEVFYEEITQLCCGDPTRCDAYRAFQAKIGR
jgi:hypothetical protein